MTEYPEDLDISSQEDVEMEEEHDEQEEGKLTRMFSEDEASAEAS